MLSGIAISTTPVNYETLLFARFFASPADLILVDVIKSNTPPTIDYFKMLLVLRTPSVYCRGTFLSRKLSLLSRYCHPPPPTLPPSQQQLSRQPRTRTITILYNDHTHEPLRSAAASVSCRCVLALPPASQRLAWIMVYIDIYRRGESIPISILVYGYSLISADVIISIPRAILNNLHLNAYPHPHHPLHQHLPTPRPPVTNTKP